MPNHLPRRAVALLLAFAAAAPAGCRAPAPAAPPPAARAAAPATFTNPIVSSQSAGDPWVIRRGGHYYLTATFAPDSGLWVWRSPTLTGIDSGTKVKVWTAPASGPLSRQIWAPELHFLRGRWYLYFTASDGIDDHHRHYVLEALTDDPLGAYKPPVRVDPEYERYAIDGSVLEMPDGRLYWMYCASGPENGVYIAPMESPTRVRGPRVRMIAGSEPWEHGWRKVGARWERDPGYWVEAPEPLVRGGRVFVAYSAGHTATPHYYVGLMTLAPGGDPMDPGAWTKRREPILRPVDGPGGGAYTTGHNGFTTSPDGREHWIVYHAKDALVWEGVSTEHRARTARAQPFAWAADGTPVFGPAVPSGVPLRKPSGE